MKRPQLSSLSKEQLKYVEELEGCLSGASELILELNLTARVFADDLKAYRTGEGDIKYIGKSDNNKKFEHTITLFDKFDKIKALSEHFKGLEKEQEKSSGNTFEDVSKKVQAKLNGSSK